MDPPQTGPGGVGDPRHKELPETNPNRPKRLSNPARGVRLLRERTPHGYILHITGTRATGAMMAKVIDQIEYWLEEP